MKPFIVILCLFFSTLAIADPNAEIGTDGPPMIQIKWDPEFINSPSPGYWDGYLPWVGDFPINSASGSQSAASHTLRAWTWHYAGRGNSYEVINTYSLKDFDDAEASDPTFSSVGLDLFVNFIQFRKVQFGDPSFPGVAVTPTPLFFVEVRLRGEWVGGNSAGTGPLVLGYLPFFTIGVNSSSVEQVTHLVPQNIDSTFVMVPLGIPIEYLDYGVFLQNDHLARGIKFAVFGDWSNVPVYWPAQADDASPISFVAGDNWDVRLDAKDEEGNDEVDVEAELEPIFMGYPTDIQVPSNPATQFNTIMGSLIGADRWANEGGWQVEIHPGSQTDIIGGVVATNQITVMVFDAWLEFRQDFEGLWEVVRVLSTVVWLWWLQGAVYRMTMFALGIRAVVSPLE